MDHKRTISRVLLGFLLAGAVYLGLNAIGLGSDQRQVSITWTGKAARVTVRYLDPEGDLIREVSRINAGFGLQDELRLAPGTYTVEVDLFTTRGMRSYTEPLTIQDNGAYTLALE